MQNKKANRKALRRQLAKAEAAAVAAVEVIDKAITAQVEVLWGPLALAVQEIEIAGASPRRSEAVGPALNELALRARDCDIAVPYLGS